MNSPTHGSMSFLKEKAPRTHEIVEAAFARSPEEGKASLRASIWAVILTQVQHFPAGNPLVAALAKDQLLTMFADLMSLYETDDWLEKTFGPVSNLFADDIHEALQNLRRARGH